MIIVKDEVDPVTGSSGFLGAHCILALPRGGYCVWTTVLSLRQESGDLTSRFKHPVPIRDAPSSTALHLNTWPFLSCETARAFFRVRAILKPLDGFEAKAGVKVSVLKLPQFTNGPAFNDICHILCLEDRQGRSAGLLQRMDDADVEPSEEIELIAISSGSVSCVDLKSAFEERIDRIGSYSYRHGMTTIRFQRVLSGGWRSHPFDCKDNMLQVVMLARGDSSLDAERVASNPIKDGKSGGDYHFYNVLWVERKGDIAYRRAAGRIPKVVWEESCSEPRVVLG